MLCGCQSVTLVSAHLKREALGIEISSETSTWTTPHSCSGSLGPLRPRNRLLLSAWPSLISSLLSVCPGVSVWLGLVVGVECPFYEGPQGAEL